MVELVGFGYGAMNSIKRINVQNITSSVFANYGYVLDYNTVQPTLINQDTCLKYCFDLDFNFSVMDDKYRLKIYIADKYEQPIKIETMERHPLGYQLFYPITDCPYIVVVAPGSEEPDENLIEAFYVQTGVGVMIRCGIWHHSLLALCNKAKYIVLENDVPGNCEFKPLLYSHEVVKYDSN